MHLMHCPKVTEGSQDLGRSQKIFLSKSGPHLPPLCAARLCAITTPEASLIMLRRFAYICLQLCSRHDIKQGQGMCLTMSLNSSPQ